jgi:hypothetical protein
MANDERRPTRAAPGTAVPTLAPEALYPLLVELANFDPELARPGDWLNYRVALDTLARAANEQLRTHIFNVGNPHRLGDLEAEVRAIHPELKQLIEQAIGERHPRVTITGGSRDHQVLRTVPIQVSAAVGWRGTLLATGSTRDTILLLVLMLLYGTERPPIGRCPECERLYLRVRRQQYCSRPCVNRANARAYRATLLDKKPATKKRRVPR